MDQHDKIDRGHQAARLLEDPLLRECLDVLETHAVGRLKACNVNDTATLQTLVLGLQAASGLRSQLSLVATSGRDALKRADEEAERARISPFRRVIKAAAQALP